MPTPPNVTIIPWDCNPLLGSWTLRAAALAQVDGRDLTPYMSGYSTADAERVHGARVLLLQVDTGAFSGWVAVSAVAQLQGPGVRRRFLLARRGTPEWTQLLEDLLQRSAPGQDVEPRDDLVDGVSLGYLLAADQAVRREEDLVVSGASIPWRSLHPRSWTPAQRDAVSRHRSAELAQLAARRDRGEGQAAQPAPAAAPEVGPWVLPTPIRCGGFAHPGEFRIVDLDEADQRVQSNIVDLGDPDYHDSPGTTGRSSRLILVTTSGDQVVLPASSGFSIHPGQSALITCRSSTAVLLDSLIIGGCPSDWVVEDLRVGGRHVQLDGDRMSSGTSWKFPIAAFITDHLDITVRNQGSSSQPFVSGFLGRTLGDGSVRMEVCGALDRHLTSVGGWQVQA